MAFTSYASVNDVIAKHKVRGVSGTVVTPDHTAPLFSATFQSELHFNLTRLPPIRSEIGAGEQVLFPILREVWREYHTDLNLFSHELLSFDADLTGYPDYFVCKQSEFGTFYPTAPYLLIVEAKLDDFAKAWGQCLAAMLAAQKLNAAPDLPVYGIATNGRTWEFGVLKHNQFTQQQEPFALTDLDRLAQALHAVFRSCRDMARAHPPTPANP
ncbi:MAG: hypothetical protein K2V38_23570 [Gemmataceae bacterium]|nr:hypothetical protein [Gemmataceae bacterium]